MSKTIDLAILYAAQKKLDALINSKHHLTYSETLEERKLAFLVELSELANATRTFKYWSQKGSEDRLRLLDEYADGLHFLLSLGLATGIVVDKISYIKSDDSKLTTHFLNVYQLFVEFMITNDQRAYLASFRSFLNLGDALGFSHEDIIAAYQNKLSINYTRQENNY